MNKVFIILFLFIMCACSSNKQNVFDDIERIPVEVHTASSDASLFLEKIEIIPLETKDSSLIGKYKKIMYDKAMDIFAIYDKNQVVSIFSGTGKFVSSSISKQGQGPEEYSMAVDIKFNPFLKGIDLLDPHGVIYTYSPEFKLLSKQKIKSKFALNTLMALSLDSYVFTNPFLWTDEEVLFANMKTQQITNVNYSGTISVENTMDKDKFYTIGDKFYFVPNGVNYYFYQIDEKAMELTPIMYLDFGNSTIEEKDLPGRATAKKYQSDKEMMELTEETAERADFLRNSNYVIPLIKFFNDDYVYVFFVQNRDPGGNFIFNRKKKEGFLLRDKKLFIMKFCFGIVDNVLMAICYPDEVIMYTDPRFMSSDEISKMKELKDDDNPVILKYYLKK